MQPLLGLLAFCLLLSSKREHRKVGGHLSYPRQNAFHETTLKLVKEKMCRTLCKTPTANALLKLINTNDNNN